MVVLTIVLPPLSLAQIPLNFFQYRTARLAP
jgi:hypothetical protein